MIGILCALDAELEALLARLEGGEAFRRSGYTYYIGTLCGQAVALCRCGVGKVNAAVCAQTMILSWPLRLIVNSGVAGALRAPLEIGDICVADDLVQHDVDTSAVGDPPGFVSTINMTYFPCAAWAADALEAAAREIGGVGVYRARIASGDQFVTDAAAKRRIVEVFEASACEMEGGAIAQVCAIAGVDCAVIRAISDSSSGRHQMEYREFMPMAARNSANVVMKFLEKML